MSQGEELGLGVKGKGGRSVRSSRDRHAAFVSIISRGGAGGGGIVAPGAFTGRRRGKERKGEDKGEE